MPPAGSARCAVIGMAINSTVMHSVLWRPGERRTWPRWARLGSQLRQLCSSCASAKDAAPACTHAGQGVGRKTCRLTHMGVWIPGDKPLTA